MNAMTQNPKYYFYIGTRGIMIWGTGIFKEVKAITPIYLFFAFMITLTWNRWTHLYIDHGREFDIPLRILKGEHLYTDILYYYGPLSPYLNALLFKVFGIHLATLHWAGIITGALILLMIYWISRRLMSITESIIVGLYTVFICSANPYWGNHIQPYSYAALYGYGFAILSLCCTIKFLEMRSLKSICLGGAAVGLAIISKPELVVLASLPIILSWVITWSAATRRRFSIRRLVAVKTNRQRQVAADQSGDESPHSKNNSYLFYPVWSFLCCVLVVAAGYGWFVYYVPYNTLITDNYALLSSPPLAHFSRILSGTNDIKHSLFNLFKFSRNTFFEELSIINWTPFLLLSFIAILLGRFFKRGINNVGVKDKILFILCVFSLSAITRVIFNIQLTSPYTALTFATSTIIIGYALFRRQKLRWLIILISALMLIVPTYVGIQKSRKYKTYAIENNRGTLIAEPYFALPLDKTIQYTEAHTKRDDYVVLLTQGTLLNFLTDRRYPLLEEIIIPSFVTGKREDDVINRLKIKAPPIIFIANLKTYEYLGGTFGIDYNQKLMKWIEQNYTRTATFSEVKKDKYEFTDDTFFITAFEKN